MRILRRHRGFAALSVLLAISVLAAMAASLLVQVAANQWTRTQQLQMDQAFYSAHAAMEFSMGQILLGGDPCVIPTRYFEGNAFTINRTTGLGGKIQVTTTRGSATNSFSINDPNPLTQATSLNVNTSNAHINGPSVQVLGVSFTLPNTSCIGSSTVTSMTLSWTPDHGYKILIISIDGSQVYNSQTGLHSGSTFSFSSNVLLTNNGSTHTLDYITWDHLGSSETITIVFNMSDGSSSSVTFSAHT